MYSTIKSDQDSVSLQSALNRLEEWCKEWQLSININKCHVLHLGRTNKFNFAYFLNGCQINDADVVTDLGVIVDPLLNFDAHINKLISKGYSRVGLLFKGFASRSPRVLRQAYVTFVRPVLEYASNVWSPHLKKHINSIERVQKHFTKRIKSLSHLCYTERLLALDIEPLELRRLKSDLVLYYKMFNNLIALLALNILANLNQFIKPVLVAIV